MATVQDYLTRITKIETDLLFLKGSIQQNASFQLQNKVINSAAPEIRDLKIQEEKLYDDKRKKRECAKYSTSTGNEYS